MGYGEACPTRGVWGMVRRVRYSKELKVWPDCDGVLDKWPQKLTCSNSNGEAGGSEGRRHAGDCV